MFLLTMLKNIGRPQLFSKDWHYFHEPMTVKGWKDTTCSPGREKNILISITSYYFLLISISYCFYLTVKSIITTVAHLLPPISCLREGSYQNIWTYFSSWVIWERLQFISLLGNTQGKTSHGWCFPKLAAFLS